ncbi:MAG: hypothetical protein LUE99_14455 [Bacteroides sp.]|nr:hypothetical protein [Bacteroides sp.]
MTGFFRIDGLIWMGVLCLLTACGDDGKADVPVSEHMDVSISLQLPEQMTVSTRAGANPTLEGIEIKDVRVFQFPTNTASTITNKLYSAATTGATGDWASLATNGTITVQTQDNDFLNEDCRFYIVVNAVML